MVIWSSFANFQLFNYYIGRADAGYIKIKANLSSVELNWRMAELGNDKSTYALWEKCVKGNLPNKFWIFTSDLY